MNNVWSMIINYLLSAVSLGMTFLYGSTGEILTEKSGHLNLGIPGIMCFGAAGGCIALELMSGSIGKTPAFIIVVIGILASFLAGALMGLLYCFLTVTLHANQNVTGLALTTFGVGAMEFAMSKIVDSNYLRALPFFRFPFAKSQTSAKYCGVMFFLAIIIALIASFVLLKTRVGLQLPRGWRKSRNCRRRRHQRFQIQVRRDLRRKRNCRTRRSVLHYGLLRFPGILPQHRAHGMACDRACHLRAVEAAYKHNRLCRVRCALCSRFIYPRDTRASRQHELHPLLKMLPYVFTVIVLIVISIRNKRENQPPAALGLNYYREDR